MRQEVKEILTEDDLNKVVAVTLEETDTIWLYEQKQTAVSTESEEYPAIMYVCVHDSHSIIYSLCYAKYLTRLFLVVYSIKTFPGRWLTPMSYSFCNISCLRKIMMEKSR